MFTQGLDGVRRNRATKLARSAAALGPRSWLLGLAAVACSLGVTTVARATPTQVQLVLDGRHERTGPDIHQGTFTASAPICASGAWWATGSELGDSKRMTCDGGTGTFLILSRGDNHEDGSTGTWAIAAGTGRYANLRGRGTWTNKVIADPTVIVRFVNTLQGTVDFDGLPPSVRITQATAARVGAGKRTFRIVLGFTTADDVAGNRVSYTLYVKDESVQLATRTGTTNAGLVRLSLLVKTRPSTRRLHVVVFAADPWGNSRSVTHPVVAPIR